MLTKTGLMPKSSGFGRKSMTQSQKACPACNSPAPIRAAVCENCGHAYRTQFTPPLDQTQVLPALPETHFASQRVRRKGKAIPSALWPALVGIALVAALLITVSLAHTDAKNRGSAKTAETDAKSVGHDAKNTPGHLVRIADAEALTPLSSQDQVLQTLGAPLQNVGDIWSYPADKGAAVGVKFAGGETTKYVQGVVVVDAAGNLVWAKTPHLWKSMPMTTSVAGKHGLPLRPLKRYLDYFTQ